MGEFADMEIERAIDAGYFFRDEPSWRRTDKHEITCRHCGEKGLKWSVGDNGEWVLKSRGRDEHNRKIIHNCRVATPSADDFDEIP